MSYETIIYDKKGHTAHITLNRPERYNAYNETMHRELFEAWQVVNKDDDIRTIVVTGAGPNFCTGADMKEAAAEMGEGKLGPKRWQYNTDFLTMFNEISHRRVMRNGIPRPPIGFPAKPIIAAIHGICCGDGLGWVYNSAFAICSEDAQFFDPHVNVAISPPGLQNFGRLAPRPIAFGHMFMGLHVRMTPARALELGIITEIVPREQLLERALELAEEVNTWCAPSAVQATSAAYWVTSNLNYVDARPWARVYANQVRFHTQDAKEARRAAREGRKPNFKGR